jgi:hypothetical protein
LTIEDKFKYFFSTLKSECLKAVPKRKRSKAKITKFHRERKTIMRRKTKLIKRLQFTSDKVKLNKEIAMLDKRIIDLHQEESSLRESRAIERIKDDPNHFFRYAKSFSKCEEGIGPFMDEHNGPINDPLAMSELLKTQYESVFSVPLMARNIPNYNDFFSSVDDARLTTFEISNQKIIKAIQSLSGSSCPGPDGLPVKLFKRCVESLLTPLRLLFSGSLSSGYIPPELKEAVIVPIYKGGGKEKPANYRPVSLTSNFIKILEKLVKSELVDYLENNNLFNESQHGFRSGRSCLSALIDIFDQILLDTSCAPKEGVDSIYLDFAKAFDRVDHGVLLHGLRSLGVAGELGTWISAFLTGRLQSVRIPGGVSSPSQVRSGVPQGTVLGPVLFVILMTNINRDVNFAKVCSFADDTRLFGKAGFANLIQDDLDKVYKWAVDNNMAFNSSKFESMNFSMDSAQKQPVYKDSEGQLIPFSDTVKDLGILMSDDCTFGPHIHALVNRCSKLAGWILRIFRSRDQQTMTTLWRSLITSRLDYGSQLWSPYKSGEIGMLERIQASFTKRIDGCSHLSYPERLQKLKLYSLERRRDRYTVIYTWKILENKVPNLHPRITSRSSDRRGGLVTMPHLPAGGIGTLMRNSFRWRGARLFNELPASLRNISNCSIDAFKLKLDKYLYNISDHPGESYQQNSLDSRIREKRWTLRVGPVTVGHGI